MSSTAILEIPEVRQRVQRWSVGDYERFVEEGIFGKNSELIRGLVFKKTSKSPLHFSLSQRLYDRIKLLLPSGCTARHEGPLRLKDSVPEPDVAVVLGEPSDFASQHPMTAELVIEVAVSSLALDRANASLYAENGVKEYWIVLAGQRSVEVYRDPVDGVYREKTVHAGEEEIVCASVPQIRLRIDSLFA